MLLLAVINILVFELTGCFSEGFPSNFPRCQLDDPDLDNCIEKSANAFLPYLKNGMDEIKLPCFDPLIIPTFLVTHESRMVNYTVEVWNFTARRLSDCHLTELKYDPETLNFNGKATYKINVPVSTGYRMYGSLASIPVNGIGIANADFGPINATFGINGMIVKRKGIEYYKPTRTTIRMTVEDGSYNFGGLFDGNQELGKATNAMLNSNSKMVTEGLTPILEKLGELALMYFMKTLTKVVPYNQLFLQPHK